MSKRTQDTVTSEYSPTESDMAGRLDVAQMKSTLTSNAFATSTGKTKNKSYVHELNAGIQNAVTDQEDAT